MFCVSITILQYFKNIKPEGYFGSPLMSLKQTKHAYIFQVALLTVYI